MPLQPLPNNRFVDLSCSKCASPLPGSARVSDGAVFALYCTTVCEIYATWNVIYREKWMNLAEAANHYGIDLEDHTTPEYDVLVTLYNHDRR